MEENNHSAEGSFNSIEAAMAEVDVAVIDSPTESSETNPNPILQNEMEEMAADLAANLLGRQGRVDRRPKVERAAAPAPATPAQPEKRGFLPTPVFSGDIISYPEAAVASLPWVMGQMFSLVWMLAIRTREGALWVVDTILPSEPRIKQISEGRCPFAVGGGHVVMPIASLQPGESWELVALVQTAAGDAFFNLPLVLVNKKGVEVGEGEFIQGTAYRYGVPSMVPTSSLSVQAFGGRSRERLQDLLGGKFPATFAEIELAPIKKIHPITHFGVGSQLVFEEKALERLLVPQMWELLTAWANTTFGLSGWIPAPEDRSLVIVENGAIMPAPTPIHAVQRSGHRHMDHYLKGPTERAHKLERPVVLREAIRVGRSLAEARQAVASFTGAVASVG